MLKDEHEEQGGPEMTEEEFVNTLDGGSQQLSDMAAEFVDEAAVQILKKDVLPMRALGISPDMMDGLYSHAYNLYSKGLYKDASETFRLLMMLDITEAKYIMGVASCQHMDKDWEAAAQTYMLATGFGPDDPLPYYHAADCYSHMGNPTAARLVLKMAIETAEEQDDYEPLIERCKLMREELKEASEQEIARLNAEEEKARVKKTTKEMKKNERKKAKRISNIIN